VSRGREKRGGDVGGCREGRSGGAEVQRKWSSLHLAADFALVCLKVSQSPTQSRLGHFEFKARQQSEDVAFRMRSVLTSTPHLLLIQNLSQAAEDLHDTFPKIWLNFSHQNSSKYGSKPQLFAGPPDQ